jgi:hypothetical protein
MVPFWKLWLPWHCMSINGSTLRAILKFAFGDYTSRPQWVVNSLTFDHKNVRIDSNIQKVFNNPDQILWKWRRYMRRQWRCCSNYFMFCAIEWFQGSDVDKLSATFTYGPIVLMEPLRMSMKSTCSRITRIYFQHEAGCYCNLLGYGCHEDCFNYDDCDLVGKNQVKDFSQKCIQLNLLEGSTKAIKFCRRFLHIYHIHAYLGTRSEFVYRIID